MYVHAAHIIIFAFGLYN